MVYIEVLNFVAAAGIVFITLYVTAPIVYDMWYNNMRDDIQTAITTNPQHTFLPLLLTGGDRLFGSFMIMGYVIPGVIIAWGFATAARKRVREDVIE